MPVIINGTTGITTPAATINGATTITGATTLSSTLGVTGATTLSSTLYSPGAIIQMQSFTYNSVFTTTTHGGSGTGPASAGTDTPLTIAITPKFSTSKITVMATGLVGYNSGLQVWLGSIKRSGASVSTAYSPAPSGGSSPGWSYPVYIAAAMMVPFNMLWTDSPATNTTINYTVRISGNNNNASPVGIGVAEISTYSSWQGTSSIVVYEVAQ